MTIVQRVLQGLQIPDASAVIPCSGDHEVPHLKINFTDPWGHWVEITCRNTGVEARRA